MVFVYDFERTVGIEPTSLCNVDTLQLVLQEKSRLIFYPQKKWILVGQNSEFSCQTAHAQEEFLRNNQQPVERDLADGSLIALSSALALEIGCSRVWSDRLLGAPKLTAIVQASAFWCGCRLAPSRRSVL